MSEFTVPTNATELLERTVTILSNPESWTQHFMARDASGEPVEAYEESAKCFCMLGAMERARYGIIPHAALMEQYANEVAMQSEHDAQAIVRHILAKRYGTGSYGISTFNDCAPHATVLSVLNESLQYSKDNNHSVA